MSERKLVYIASPYAGDVDRNIETAKLYCRFALQNDCDFIAPHLLYPQVLNDDKPSEREACIKMGVRLLAFADELWVCEQRISEGMKIEIEEAKRLGIPIRNVSQSEIEGEKQMKKHGIWAKRSAASVFGAAESWAKSDGKPLVFDTREQAAENAAALMKNIGTANVSYFPKEMDPEMSERLESGMKMSL
jgi:hypothetical protein